MKLPNSVFETTVLTHLTVGNALLDPRRRSIWSQSCRRCIGDEM